MADRIFKICSYIRTDDKKPIFWISERKGFFKKWIKLESSHEKFEDDKLIYIPFSSYEETEKYLLEKYSKGNTLEKDGNIYKLTYPRYYY